MSIPSFFKPTLRFCALLTGIILFSIFVYRTGFALYHNHQLRTGFSADKASPYQQGTPLEKMDLATYAPYFPNTFAAPAYHLIHLLASPVSLQYYTEIPTEKTAIALEIPKGTTIIAIPEETKGSALQEVGYGYTSYPTYNKGWRYVRPFNTAEGLNQVQSEQYYFVNIDSLEAVLNKVIEINKPFRAIIRQQRWTLAKGEHFITRYIDNVLYQNGAYLSPDLFYRVLDRWNILMLGVSGMLIVVYINYRRHN